MIKEKNKQSWYRCWEDKTEGNSKRQKWTNTKCVLFRSDKVGINKLNINIQIETISKEISKSEVKLVLSITRIDVFSAMLISRDSQT